MLALFGVGCSSAAPADGIGPEALAELLASEAPPIVLDVRSAEEFATGHIPGALNIPHDRVGRDLDAVGDRDRVVVTYCVVGARSAHAADALRDGGFHDVRLLTGDIGGWQEAGYAVETGAP